MKRAVLNAGPMIRRHGSQRARQCRRGLQPRAGERSEAAWSGTAISLRAILPLASILPRKVANLAYFGSPPL